MPVTVRRRNGKFRVVEAATGNLARNAGGSPVDGGGHETRAKATMQARAVNSKAKR